MSSFTSSINNSKVNSLPATSNHSLHRSSAVGIMTAADAASLVTEEFFAEEKEGKNIDAESSVERPLFNMGSLLDDHEDDEDSIIDNDENNDNVKVNTSARSSSTTCSESRCPSQISVDDAVALEVGLSAHSYLEECFYTEVSVLDRDKFDAVPEIIKSDFSIRSHLGKGSFSDVFEVVCKGGQLLAKNIHPGAQDLAGRRQRTAARGRRSSISRSITTATFERPHLQGNGDKLTFAMKCLRPQIRSDVDQFTMGAEDLVHETAILANLNHRHIIKLHGRASGHLTNAFVLNDGYFIILDKLKETLSDRIKVWKRNSKYLPQGGPQVKQFEIARDVSSAMEYLHSKNILFRDLKPDNVGFDSMGVLKLFDFGFAVGLPEKTESDPEGYIFDRCGTPRYMAPEVGLNHGYGLKADIYSFGILLWEICSLSKPFASINSSSKFERAVFMKGVRPVIESSWHGQVKDLMAICWSASPYERPTMTECKSRLSEAITTNSGGAETKASMIAAHSRFLHSRRVST